MTKVQGSGLCSTLVDKKDDRVCSMLVHVVCCNSIHFIFGDSGGGNSYADAYSLPKLFFPFFILTYVGFVPVSDVLAIFVSDRQCEFPSKFWFVIEKKTSFGRKFWEVPWSTKTKHVLVNPK